MKKLLLLVTSLATAGGIASSLTSCDSKKIEAIMFMDKTTNYDENQFSQGIYNGFKGSVSNSKYVNVKDDTVTGRKESLKDGVDQGMRYAVLASYAFQGSVNDYAKEFPSVKFIGADFKEENPRHNVASAWISIESAAFLAGYGAANFLQTHDSGLDTNTKKVGIIGGFGFKTVTDYYEGFLNGVKYANAHHGTFSGTWKNVTVANPASQLKAFTENDNSGWWTNSWNPASASFKSKFQTLVDAKVDAIIGSEMLAWSHNKEDSAHKLYVIGADKDMSAEAAAVNQSDTLITSIIKDLGKLVSNIINDDKKGGTAFFGSDTPLTGNIKDGSSNIVKNNLSDSIYAEIKTAIDNSKIQTPTDALALAALNSTENLVDGAFTKWKS